MSSGGYYFNAYNESARSNFIDDVELLPNVDSFVDSPDYIINKEKFIDFFVEHDGSSYEEVINLLRCYYDPYVCDVERIDSKNNYLDHDYHSINEYDSNKKTFVVDSLLNMTQPKIDQRFSTNRIEKINYTHLLSNIDVSRLQTDYNSINKIGLSEAALLKEFNFLDHFRKFKFMLPEIEMLVSIFYNKFGEPTIKINPLNVAYDIGMLGDIINLVHDSTLTNALLKINNNKKLFDNVAQKIIRAKKLHRDTDHLEDDWSVIMRSLDSEFQYIFEYIKNKLFGDSHKLKRFINCYSMKIIDDVAQEFSNISFAILIKNFMTDIVGENEKQIIKNDKALDKIDGAETESNIDNLKNFVHDRQLKMGIPYKNTLLAASIKSRKNITIDDDIIKNINKICLLKHIEESFGVTTKEESIDAKELFNVAVRVWKQFLNTEPLVFSPSEIKLYGDKKFVAHYENNIAAALNAYTDTLRNATNKISSIISNDHQINEIVVEYINNKLRFVKGSNKNGSKLLFNPTILRIIATKADFLSETDTNIFVRLPTCNISLQKEIGTIEETNIFAATLKRVNETLSSIINPPMKLAANMLNELIMILCLVAKINAFYGTKCNAGSAIMYMYSTYLFSQMPKYSSKLVAIENMFGDYNYNGGEKSLMTKHSHDLGAILDINLYESIGYNNYTGVADCVESTIRDFINCLILQQNKLNIGLLPQSTLPEIRSFYEKYNTLDSQYLDEPREDWIEIFNGTIKERLEEKYPDNKSTFFELRTKKYVDMESSFMTFTNALMIIFGIDGTTPLTHEHAKRTCENILKMIAEMFSKKIDIQFEGEKNMMLIQLDANEFRIYDGHSQMKPVATHYDQGPICAIIHASECYELLKLIVDCKYNRKIDPNRITNADYIYCMSENYCNNANISDDEYIAILVKIVPTLSKYNLLNLFLENEINNINLLMINGANHRGLARITKVDSTLSSQRNIDKKNIVSLLYNESSTRTIKYEIVNALFNNNIKRLPDLLNVYAFNHDIIDQILRMIQRSFNNIKHTSAPILSAQWKEHIKMLSDLYYYPNIKDTIQDDIVISLVADNYKNAFDLLSELVPDSILYDKVVEEMIVVNYDNFAPLLFYSGDKGENLFADFVRIEKQIDYESFSYDDPFTFVITLTDLKNIYYGNANAHTANKLYLVMMAKFIGNVEGEKNAYYAILKTTDAAHQKLMLEQMNQRYFKNDEALLDKMKAANISYKIIDYLKYRTIDKYVDDGGQIGGIDYYSKYKKYKSKYLSLKY